MLTTHVLSFCNHAHSPYGTEPYHIHDLISNQYTVPYRTVRAYWVGDICCVVKRAHEKYKPTNIIVSHFRINKCIKQPEPPRPRSTSLSSPSSRSENCLSPGSLRSKFSRVLVKLQVADCIVRWCRCLFTFHGKISRSRNCSNNISRSRGKDISL